MIDWRLVALGALFLGAAIGYVLGVATVMRDVEEWRPPVCRMCGCTDLQACPEGCWWVGPNLCSSCDYPRDRRDGYARGLSKAEVRVRIPGPAQEGI
jgi:hypothetical protein